ncbi:hypothetical protein [Paenirhodobacter sp.]|jgi:hypothetical protein|uniref:hypothetical protein n=1 Tax=Paenirhodobacter sp. TaxID=1965326 RepID=UPI003B50891E
MRYFVFGLLLAGCGHSPAPQFFGADRHEVTTGGVRFVVYQKEDQAEVVRLGFLTRRQRDAVPVLMTRAAEEATGCRVTGPAAGPWRSPSLPGDTGEARLQLKCPPI